MAWTTFNPANSVVDDRGFARVNLGGIYDTAKKKLEEDTYNTAADAGFGALRAGPYVSSLHQNIGNLQGQMASRATDLAEAEATRRTQQTMQGTDLAAQEKRLGMELGSRASLQSTQLAAEKERQETDVAAQKARLGMELSSRERMLLSQLTEQGRQFDVTAGQNQSQFLANLAMQQQGVEDARYQQYLNFLFGGAHGYTQPTGRVLPNSTTTPTTPSPFSQLMGPILGGAGTQLGMRAGSALATVLP